PGPGRSGGGTGTGPTPQASDQKSQAGGKTVGSTGANADGADKTMTVKFLPGETGIRDRENGEITSGVPDGVRVITTGAGALKDGDRVTASATNESGRPSSMREASNGTTQKTSGG